MSNFPLVSDHHRIRLEDPGPTSPDDQVITLTICGNHISFAFVAYSKISEDKNQCKNSSEIYGRTSVAHLLINEPKTEDVYQTPIRLKSTWHDMLSDGDIVRIYQPNKMQAEVADPVDRVWRAIIGTVLAHCNEEHVLDRRILTEAAHRVTDKVNLKVVFNRYEFLKIFHTIQPPVDNQIPGMKKTYSIRTYSKEEIWFLLISAYKSGTTFSVQPAHQAARRTYLQGLRRMEAVGATSSDHVISKPTKLMILARAADFLEEKERKRPLSWD